MKISPISITNFSKMSFKGQEVYYSRYEGENYLKNSSYWHKNSSIDKTLGSYHSNQTGKAYYADPLEPITDAIRDRVDYIIYDNEPSYPKIEEVETNYLGINRTNYRNDFEEIRKYYYRREMAGYADKSEAQYQQWQAAECTGFYDRAGDARFRKESLEDNIVRIDRAIKEKEKENIELNASIGRSEKEKCLLEIKQKNYQAKNDKYSELNNLAEQTIDKDKEEINFIKSQIDNMKNNIKKCQEKIKICIANIDYCKKKIELNKSDIVVLNKDKKTKTNLISEIIEKELKPMFNALKEFYVKQGIKIIK